MLGSISPITLEYLIGAAIALILSLHIARENFRSFAYRAFLAFGFSIAIWQVMAFLHRNAINEYYSLIFLKNDFSFGLLAQQFLLLTILSLRKESRKNLLALLPAAAIPLYYLYIKVELYKTMYGWSYRIIEDFVGITTYFMLSAYVLAIFLTLLFLLWEIPPLRKKLSFILAGYAIYIVVLSTINLLVFPADPHFPPIGGFLSLIMFLFIAYAIQLKVPLETAVKPAYPPIEITDSFQLFLNRLFNIIPGEALGQKILDFKRFVKESGIDRMIKIDENKILILPDRMQPVEFLEKTSAILEHLEDKKWWEEKLAGYFLSFVNNLYSWLLSVKAKEVADAWLEGFVKEHEEFLKKSDMIYGIVGGEGLKFLVEDESLKDESPWNACIRIYKRMLLAAADNINKNLGDTFIRRALMHDLTSHLDFTYFDRGLILSGKIEKQVMEISEEERLSRIKESFNTLFAWVCESLKKTSEEEFKIVLHKMKTVLWLNREKAKELNVKKSLLETLSRTLSSEDLKIFYLAKGFSEDDLEIFSSSLGITHQHLTGMNILLEFDPREEYEVDIKNFIVENLANGEKCYVFTRRKSKIHEVSSEFRDVYFYFVSPATSHIVKVSDKEFLVPITDLSQILSVIEEISKKDPYAGIVFDNVSDMVFILGFDTAYKFLRHVIDILSTSNNPAILLLNQSAHNEEVKAAFEALFKTIMTTGKKIMSSLKSK